MDGPIIIKVMLKHAKIYKIKSLSNKQYISTGVHNI